MKEELIYIDDPSIVENLMYSSKENFVGEVIDGYENNRAMLTPKAVLALKFASDMFKKDGFSIVVFDAYRPRVACEHFIKWAKKVKDQKRKYDYYPYVDKTKLFDLGYIAEDSMHCKGLAVDVSLVKTGNRVFKRAKKSKRTLLDGSAITYIDFGCVDFGSHIDYFGVASNHDSNLVSQEQAEKRKYLSNIMTKAGFETYSLEWWHYALN